MNALEAKVKAVNEANRVAQEIYAILKPVVAKFVGCKILTASGEFTKEFAKALPNLDFPDIQIYSQRKYNLSWSIKTCVSYSGTCVYHEVGAYFGSINNQILMDVDCVPPDGRTNWTVEEIRQKREELKIAEEILDKIKSGLRPFENDR